MTEISVGDVIEYRCQSWQVRDYDGLSLHISCLDDGEELVLPVGILVSDDTFVGPDSPGPSIADQRLLDLADPHRRRHAEFWYAHMFEVKHGIALHDRGVVEAPSPASTVESRLARKRTELLAAGIKISMSTMWRRWARFNRGGTLGCIDLRGMPGHVRLPQVSQQVERAVEAAKYHFINKSTPTKKQVIEVAARRLTDDDVPVPCRSTMYTLMNKLDRGEHTTGDATSRRSHANSPDRAYRNIVALFPGEEVQLDSTPLDAMVLMADGEAHTVDLAAGIDVATRTLISPILRPNACKSVDALEIWANAAVPQQMLPGWKDRMAIARNYLPDIMCSQEALDTALDSKPLIDVRGLVVDRGKIFVSQNFIRATESRGVNYRLSPPFTPTAKPHIERLLETIGDDFVRWIPGYKGRSVNHRGKHPERDAVWPLPLLQALLDEWVITVYQNRRHAGLTVSTAPRMTHSPNAMYRALSQIAPTPIRTLSRDEWISMQPHEFRRINRYGINLFNLVYDNDTPEFHQLRRRLSPNKKQNGRWEIRYDPNNLLQIWVRNQSLTYDENDRPIVKDEGWIECPWVLAQHVTIPFGVDILRAIKSDLSSKLTDRKVLERAEQIHARLLGGPPKPRQRPLTRGETLSGRRNLSRQELGSVLPASHANTTSRQQEKDSHTPSNPLVPPARSVEAMRPMRLSDGW